MTEKREVQPSFGITMLAVSIMLHLVAILIQLDRIADALERAYPAQEQTP